jgi:hypothetical protein
MRGFTAKALTAAGVATVALTVVAASSPARQQTAPLPAVPSPQSIADAAVALAQNQQSAGVIIRLPARLETALQREQTQPGGFLINRSPFGVWIRNEVSGPGQIPTLRTPGEVDTAVAGFATQFGVQATRWRRTSTYVLRSAEAGACAVQLRAPLRADVEHKHLVDLVSAAINNATGAEVPGGFVGSCVGDTEYRAEPVRLPAGVSLEEALNTAVTTFGGAVWVAVQDAGARCSLGLIRSSHAGTACKTAITTSLEPRRE